MFNGREKKEKNKGNDQEKMTKRKKRDRKQNVWMYFKK